MISGQDWYLTEGCEPQIQAAPGTFPPLTAREGTVLPATGTWRSWQIELAVLQVSFEFVQSEIFFVCVKAQEKMRAEEENMHTHTHKPHNSIERPKTNFLHLNVWLCSF